MKEREELKEEYSKTQTSLKKLLNLSSHYHLKRKIPKVTEPETIHAHTAEQQQQEEMERLLKENNKE